MGVLRQSRMMMIGTRTAALRRQATARRDSGLLDSITRRLYPQQASLSSQSRALSHGLPGALWLVSMTSSKLSSSLPTKRSTELDIAPACSPARASADPKSALLTRQRPTLSCRAQSRRGGLVAVGCGAHQGWRKKASFSRGSDRSTTGGTCARRGFQTRHDFTAGRRERGFAVRTLSRCQWVARWEYAKSIATRGSSRFHTGPAWQTFSVKKTAEPGGQS